MKIQLKRWTAVLTTLIAGLMLAVFAPFYLMTAFAAEARIAFTDPSVMVGKEVNVTMKISSTGGEALGGADVTLSYDPNVLEFVGGSGASGGAGSVRVVGSMDSANTTQFKFSLKFKALQAGKTKITVARQEVNDINTQPVTVSKQGDSTVNVTPLATYSKDANLKSLKIDPGTLTPKFSSDVTEYTAEVGGDTSKLVVSAGTSNANAKVVISGTDLKTGENTVVCKVTAEDGQTVKKYTIKVTRSETTSAGAESPEETKAVETGEVKATVDGVEYGVASSFDPGLLPQGFQTGTTVYQGSEVASAVGNGMTLLYLVGESGSGFYLYDETAGTLTAFAQIASEPLSIIPVPLEKGVAVPQGFAEDTIDIAGHSVDGWVWNSGEGEPAYFVFYAMDSGGLKDFYRYDLEQKTLQRYFQDPNADAGVSTEKYVEVAENYNSLIGDYKIRLYIIIALLVVSLVLLIMVVILLKTRKDRPFDPGDPDDGTGGGRRKERRPKKPSPLDFLEEEDEEFDEYYDEPEDGEPRSRREFEPAPARTGERRGTVKEGKEARPGGYDAQGPDDFDELGDLEDLERSLAERIAREEQAAAQEIQRRRPAPGRGDGQGGGYPASQSGTRRPVDEGRHVTGVSRQEYEEDRRRPQTGDVRPPARRPAGYPADGDQARRPVGYPADGDQARRPADYPADGDQARRPAGYPADGDQARRPAGYSTDGDQARRPVGYSSEEDKTRRPVGSPRGEGQTRRPVGRPIEGDQARRPVGNLREEGQTRRPVGRPMDGDQTRRPVGYSSEDDQARRPVGYPLEEEQARRSDPYPEEKEQTRHSGGYPGEEEQMHRFDGQSGHGERVRRSGTSSSEGVPPRFSTVQAGERDRRQSAHSPVTEERRSSQRANEASYHEEEIRRPQVRQTEDRRRESPEHPQDGGVYRALSGESRRRPPEQEVESAGRRPDGYPREAVRRPVSHFQEGDRRMSALPRTEERSRPATRPGEEGRRSRPAASPENLGERRRTTGPAEAGRYQKTGTRPVEEERIRRPAVEPVAERRPTAGDDGLARFQGAPVRRPVQNQEEGRSTVSPAARRRNQEDSDFEFIDLD